MSVRATETPEEPGEEAQEPLRPATAPGKAAADTGLTLVSHDGKPYRFDPGALCLELLTTGGPGAFARHEVLHGPADLVAWADRSRLPGGLRPTVTAAEVERARAFRDALFLLAADRAHGRPLRPEHVEEVNAVAAGPPLVSQLTSDGARVWAPGATGAQLLSTVARDAVDLFGGPHAGRVRECGARDCYLLFVDTSRPGRRHWCSMERCGNRAKVRAHRARTSAREGDPGAG
ncbi:ABATE domain-containing protein [Streptomyces actuosus]|uniref:ABATE domain-containing protein n=1 Tax=Streptomyces actuosus TaxID=1885 RepID=A0ABS2VUF0_STRAS|nr:ABATE domain-containing protein [Streptomyces actuosus]MBN0046670.1 ABATE domain-containing protein [Streptomyces actuosus]